MRESLKADGAGEAVDGERANRGEARVGGGGVRPSVDHGVGDFDAGGKAVEDDAAGLLLEYLDQLAVGGEIFVVAEDGCGEVAVEPLGDEFHIDCVASNEKRIRAKDFVREALLALSASGFVKKLLAIRGEELGFGQETN